MTILDLDCFDDLDEYGGEITDPLTCLRQDNYHRLITPPGRNLDDPDFGLGLDLLLSGSAADVMSVGPRAEAELLKDSRNGEVVATVTTVRQGVYDLSIAIVPNADELGPLEAFTMVLRTTPTGSELRS